MVIIPYQPRMRKIVNYRFVYTAPIVGRKLGCPNMATKTEDCVLSAYLTSKLSMWPRERVIAGILAVYHPRFFAK